MGPKLYLAFLYHHHQPMYKDLLTDKSYLPWVMLHVTKDYYDMVAILDEFPQIKLNFNITPSLITQILDYADGRTDDVFLNLARKPANELSETDKFFILKNFFIGNRTTMIFPYDRYAELLNKRGQHVSDEFIKKIMHKFSIQDMLDLQVFISLVWFDPYWKKNDDFIDYLFKKKKKYTEQEKIKLLDKQIQLCKELFDKYKSLQESGKIEITTSPFYHPVIPILINSNLSRKAMPAVVLPENTISFPEDANVQISKAVELYQKIFGTTPKGMWPSEGAVCSEMIPILQKAGIEWIATDEEILFNTLKEQTGVEPQKGVLYMPYIVKEGKSSINIIFRDRTLSDAISFIYHKWGPEAAVNNILNHLQNIYQMASGFEPFVSIIMDGENCWDSYKNDGWDFLTTLYERISNTEWIETVTISKYLKEHPPRVRLDNLWPGSWINANYGVWIGHWEDNTAWDYLYEARKTLLDYISNNPDKKNSPEIRKAWEEIYIAEGSDWFWWYGDEFSSGYDDIFDFLFRKHLMNVYSLLGLDIPEKLFIAIKGRFKKALRIVPTDFITPQIDGKITNFFEWHFAGMCETYIGTALFQSVKLISMVYWGFNTEKLFLRLDPEMKTWSVEVNVLKLKIDFIRPSNTELDILITPPYHIKDVSIMKNGTRLPATEVKIAINEILEIELPFVLLEVKPEEDVEFTIAVTKIEDEEEYELERWPYMTSISLKCPSQKFKISDWVV